MSNFWQNFKDFLPGGQMAQGIGIGISSNLPSIKKLQNEALANQVRLENVIMDQIRKNKNNPEKLKQLQVIAKNNGPSDVLVYAVESVTGGGGWSTCAAGAIGSLGIPLVAGAEGVFSFRAAGASQFISIAVWDGGLNLGCTGTVRLLTADERAPINV